MDPNKLLDEVQKNRATWRNKLKWFWFGCCLKCGGKLVVGHWTRGFLFDYWEKPKCEWCSAVAVPVEDRIYKIVSWRQSVVCAILFLVLLLVIAALIKYIFGPL
ncbi:MAG: hypothetical protein HYY86_01080 [Candidatus Harrisonbacteria bacterium]|nr:hypothetical protein [Candidatus Harrisonbacteria bacterium]